MRRLIKSLRWLDSREGIGHCSASRIKIPRLSREFWRLPLQRRRQWQQKEVANIKKEQGAQTHPLSPDIEYQRNIKECLWGLSTHAEPLKCDEFAKAVMATSSRPGLHGMRHCLPPAHGLVRERGFVRDVGDLRTDELVYEHVPCGILHPGLCSGKMEDAVYSLCVEFTKALTKLIAEDGVVGDCYRIKMAPKPLQVTVVVAHIRYANPKQVVLVRALVQEDTLRLMSTSSPEGRILQVTYASQVAKTLLSTGAGPNCSLMKLQVEPSRTTLGEFRVLSMGDAVDLDYIPQQSSEKKKQKKSHKSEEDRAFDAAFKQVLPEERPRGQAHSSSEVRPLVAPRLSFASSLRRRVVEDSASEKDSDTDLELISTHFRAHRHLERGHARAQRRQDAQRDRPRGHRTKRQARPAHGEEDPPEVDEEAPIQAPEDLRPSVMSEPVILPAGSASSSSQPSTALAGTYQES